MVGLVHWGRGRAVWATGMRFVPWPTSASLWAQMLARDVSRWPSWALHPQCPLEELGPRGPGGRKRPAVTEQSPLGPVSEWLQLLESY